MSFCTSLRRRASFAEIIPALIANNDLKEYNLSTHDLSIPIGQKSSSLHRLDRHLRCLLLSPSTKSDVVLARVQRLVANTGGHDLAIIFLLTAKPRPSIVATHASSTTDMASDTMTYNQVHTQLLAHPDTSGIPVLPLATLSKLPALLQNYVKTLSHIKRHVNPSVALTAFEILQECTVVPPMEQSVAYFITDTFKDLRELAMACSTVTTSDLQSMQEVDDLSPYFSSSSSLPTPSSDKHELQLASKLRKLFAFDKASAMNIVKFWQAEVIG